MQAHQLPGICFLQVLVGFLLFLLRLLIFCFLYFLLCLRVMRLICGMFSCGRCLAS